MIILEEWSVFTLSKHSRNVFNDPTLDLMYHGSADLRTALSKVYEPCIDSWGSHGTRMDENAVGKVAAASQLGDRLNPALHRVA